MAEFHTLHERLEALRQCRASGILEITKDGRTVRYRNDAELFAAISDVERQISQLNKSPVRSLRVGTNKGF